MKDHQQIAKGVLLVAYAVARDALSEYGHRCSPKKFAQHQLFACLVVKTMLKLDYRGASALLEDCPEPAPGDQAQ